MCLAVPGRVVHVTGEAELRSARIDFDGVRREASLVFVPEAEVGDYVLVHVGFAISVIDEELARETLAALRTLDLPEPLDGADSIFAGDASDLPNAPDSGGELEATSSPIEAAANESSTGGGSRSSPPPLIEAPVSQPMLTGPAVAPALSFGGRR